MSRSHRSFKVVIGILFLAMASVLVVSHTAAAATFDRSRIIDDGVFNNYNTMNASQINAFLNGFPNSCISPNSGFLAAIPAGYSPVSGYSYGNYATAGEVIATAAQVYGINPQVLLTTLQKEQSLVVGGASYCNDGDEHKYAAATGYGCPDSGGRYSYSGVSLYMRNGVVHSVVGPTCVNSAAKAGFSQQLIRAAWLLKFGQERANGNMQWAVIKGSWDNSDDPESCYGGPVTAGWRQVCPSGATTYYDGYKTIDGTAVLMSTGATSALYWYTPHFSGNQNFFNIFTGWFGLPYSYDTEVPHPNGTVITDGRTAYLIQGSTRQVIASPAIFMSYKFAWDQVKAATTGDINLTQGQPLATLAPGTLFTTGDGNVYITDYFNGTLEKQLVSAATFMALGFRWDQILTCAGADAPATTEPGYYAGSRHPAGSLIQSGGSVYSVDETSRRYVSAVAFLSNHYRWDSVVPANAGDNSLPLAGPASIREGTMLLAGGGIYLIDTDASGNFKRPVGPYECFADRMHYTPADWIVVDAGILPPRTGSILTC